VKAEKKKQPEEARVPVGTKIQREVIAWFWVGLAFLLINGTIGQARGHSFRLHGKYSADWRSPDHEPHRVRRRRALHEFPRTVVAQSPSASRWSSSSHRLRRILPTM